MQKLNELHKEFLEEMVNIGANNASKLLSDLIHTEVKTAILTVDIVSPKTMLSLIAGTTPKKLLVVQYAPIGGMLRGTSFLILPREDALHLLDLLRKKKPGTTQWLSKEDQDVLKRVSISMVRCYLDAISDFLKIKVNNSELRTFSTFGETITDLIDLSLKKRTKPVFYLNTKLYIEPDIKGEFYFLFEKGLSIFLARRSTEILPRYEGSNDEKGIDCG